MKVRDTRPEVFCKKGALRNFAKFTGKHLCQSHFLIKLQACNFIKKETLPQVFSCEYCEIFRAPFLTEHLRWLLLKVLSMSKRCTKYKGVPVKLAAFLIVLFSLSCKTPGLWFAVFVIICWTSRQVSLGL